MYYYDASVRVNGSPQYQHSEGFIWKLAVLSDSIVHVSDNQYIKIKNRNDGSCDVLLTDEECEHFLLQMLASVPTTTPRVI